MAKRKTPPLEEWLTTAQAADCLGVTDRHIRHLIKIGELEARLLADRWLVNPVSVEGWERKRKPKGDKPIA